MSYHIDNYVNVFDVQDHMLSDMHSIVTMMTKSDNVDSDTVSYHSLIQHSQVHYQSFYSHDTKSMIVFVYVHPFRM